MKQLSTPRSILLCLIALLLPLCFLLNRADAATPGRSDKATSEESFYHRIRGFLQTTNIVQEELPEAGALRRRLTPMVIVGPGECDTSGADVFGCQAGFHAACILHKEDHCDSQCYDMINAGPFKVGEPIPDDKGDKVVLACGPCTCYPELEAEIASLGLPLKEKSKNTLEGFASFDCSSLLISEIPSSKPSLQPSETPSAKPSEIPSSKPTDSCVSCDGDVEIVYKNVVASFRLHHILARGMGCELASITSGLEQAAAIAAIGPDPSGLQVWIGAQLENYSESNYQFTWIDGSGSFVGVEGKGADGVTDSFSNWLTGDPDNGRTETAVALSFTDPASFGGWVNLQASLALPALYKCCVPAAKDFSACQTTPCTPHAQFCTGTAEQVNQWCNLFKGTRDACCESEVLNNPACVWGGDATVTILKRSCNGPSACDFGTSSSASITVGTSSCNGPNACADIASTRGESVSIGSNFCQGKDACYQTAKEQGKSVSIGTNSCKEGNACALIASLEGESVSIGSNSCQGPDTCYGLAYSLGTFVSIADGSCIAGCGLIGALAATSVTIGANSCQGLVACSGIGLYSAELISIGSGSCLGMNTCLQVGFDNAKSVDILDSACGLTSCGISSGGTSCTRQDGVEVVQCRECTCSSKAWI